jgi:hypothetical protein
MTIDPNLLDYFPPEHDGYPADMAAEDTADALREAAGDAAREFPRHLWIEPRDWAAVSAENDRYKTWPENYRNRFTNQYNTHECTCHSLVQVAEMCWNKQAKGKRWPVYLSCLSIYAEANPRIRGGANVRGVLEIAARRGFLPDKIQPKEYAFKHSLIGTAGKGNATQSSGQWVALGKFPDGWQQTARHFKPLEIIFPDSWEQIVCLVLNGYAVGVGRNGHAVPYVKWMHADQAMMYSDSYDLHRYDSTRTIRSAVGGAFAIASFTMPDDWNKPAG